MVNNRLCIYFIRLSLAFSCKSSNTCQLHSLSSEAFLNNTYFQQDPCGIWISKNLNNEYTRNVQMQRKFQ